MCATTIAVVVDSRATAYSRIMQWLHRIGEAIDSLVAWWRRSLIGRVIDRYVSRRGPLLANGLAYGLLFAFFAGVWIVVSALGLVVTGSEEMQKALLAMLRTVIPSVSDSLFSASMLSGISHTLTWTGLVTLAVFWWTVTGWMNSLRNAVTTMFDDCTQELNVVKARLRDTVAAIMVAVLFILSTAAGVVSGGLMRLVLRALGIADDSLPGALLLESTGFATGVLLNFALFMLLLRVVAHIRAGKFTLVGAALGALAVAVMQLLGARLLTGASRNPMLAPFAAIIGVLIWFNLVAQVIMICAAFIAECRRGGGESRSQLHPLSADRVTGTKHCRIRYRMRRLRASSQVARCMSFMRCAAEHMTRGEFPWRLMYMVQHGAATATVPRTRSTGSAPLTRGTTSSRRRARLTVPLRSAAKSTSRSCSMATGRSRSSRPSWTSRTSSRSLACSGER